MFCNQDVWDEVGPFISLGSQNADVVFGSQGSNSGLNSGILHRPNLTQDHGFYPTSNQPELSTSLEHMCVFGLLRAILGVS
jgi:hypothetical protein